MPKLYQLSDGEREIIQKARKQENPDIFTNWFLKSETSGFYYRPSVLPKYLDYKGYFPEIWQRNIDRYQRLFEKWQELGEPDEFQHRGKTFEVQWQNTWDEPIFFVSSGFIFLPWQMEMVNATQRVVVVIGGYGSGKNVGAIADVLYDAATLPDYRAVFLAPNSTQAMESWRIALSLMRGTPYEEKFLIHKRSKAPAALIVGHKDVGENLIECYPIGDPEGVSKLETLTLDRAIIDQAERLDNIEEIVRVIGSRFRGQRQGRVIEGQMTFLANAKDNPELYDLYDQAEEDPRRVKALAPTTFENEYITMEQLMDIEKDVGGSEESIRVHIKGGRPLFAGEHFPTVIQDKMRSPILDARMERGLEEKRPGYKHIKYPRIGTVEWELPPEEGRLYCVIADPGTDNPPKRNAAVILAWDYTDFPAYPATLQAFNWVFGNHRPDPWITKYLEYIDTYGAKLSNAFDSTAWQSGWQETLWAMDRTISGGMHMHVANKARCLNFTKRMAERELLKVPSIQGMFDQLGRYQLPDTRLKQDIVMALIMSAGWLEHLMYADEETAPRETQASLFNMTDPRYAPEPTGRYATYMEPRW